MHRNENKYDQLFRNRLRDLSHPVRNELWSRIHGGIRGKASVPHPRTKLPFLSSAVHSNGFLLTAAAAAAVGITLGIIHFTHTMPPPSPQPVNHYSKITPAIAPAGSAGSTGKSSVTPQDSSRGLSPENAATTTAVQPSHGAGASSIGRARARPLLERSLTTGDHITSGDRITTARHHYTSEDPGAHGMSAVTETMPGTEHSIHRRNGNPATLPAMARTSMRAAITAGAPGSKYRHNGSNASGNWPAFPPFHRTGYLSLYASPDFPNHYYAWSYTLGGRLTFQFSRRWSFTAGFEYARVNVPTQAVPPTNDILQAFHFSNYEVPVLFGYTRSFRRATLTVNGGAILNLYFHQSTSAWVNNWPDRDSYGAVLGVDYSYPLGRHLAIFAQPYARYSISDYRMFTQAQRWSFGTLLGIKYRL